MNEPLAAIPGWIAELVSAVASLSGGQLRSLASAYREGESAPPPSTLLLQRNLSLSIGDAIDLARKLRQVMVMPDVTGHDVRTALATLAQARSIACAGNESIEVVCTAPFQLAVPVRTTFATAIEMVQEAREEIYVVGYVFTEGARGFIEQLARARRSAGVQVTLIGNRMEDRMPFLRSVWPIEIPPPKIFSRKAEPTDDMAALHAKLLICDGLVALVTSANFSYHGLHENIEIGVKIRSGSVARMVEFVQAMIRTGEVGPVDRNS